ncbi:hypothetical protein KR044_002124 [Drosophila immigrans]|nr:hypothetical protein KR044_002124 [Drosophila immigrans]
MSTNVSKKSLKRHRKHNQNNSKSEKGVKLQNAKRINYYEKALQDKVGMFCDQLNSYDLYDLIGPQVSKDENKRNELWNGFNIEWKPDKDFFKAPDVISGDMSEDEELHIDNDYDDLKQNIIDEDAFLAAEYERIDDAEIVKARVVPKYKELDSLTLDTSEDDLIGHPFDDVEDEQDVPEDGAIEKESEDDESDQQILDLDIEDDCNMRDMEALDDAQPIVNGKSSGESDAAAHFYSQPTAEVETLPELSVFENSLKTNKVLAVLKQDVEWYGTVIVTLLSGRISINGHEAQQLKPLTIYSPKGYAWVVISPKASKKPKPPKVALSDNSELAESFSRAQLDNIWSNFDPRRDAIVLLQRNSRAQKMLSTFGKHMAENVFPLINATNRPHYPSEYLLNCLVQGVADPEQGLQVPTVWTKLALQQDTRCMITGGKGVGKSTLLRYLLNRNVTQFGSVLLVDLDIGQPELFVPQTVSCSVVDAPLLGPGFFLNRQPELAYVVGHVDIVMCAQQYALAVKRLLAHCHQQERYKNMPWLINTMGYNKGFGVELMALLVDAVKPTALVQIFSRKPINNFDVSLDSATLSSVEPTIYVGDEFTLSLPLPKYTMHRLESAVPQQQQQQRQNKSWRMSAKDMRYSNMLARLSAALRGNAKHLPECQPLKTSLDKLEILQLTSDGYSRQELIEGAEVNLVYLCKQPAKGHKTVECFGIGVVRAVNYKKNTLYLLPAMPLERCSAVNCLVIGGDMCLPQGFIKDQGANVTNQVPFVFVIDDSKSSKSVQQIYHRAPAFLGNPAKKNV